VRSAVAAFAARREAKRPEARIVHELAVCQAAARIDVACINGRLDGWEIKTAADTLTRLPRQQELYSRVFDRMWLVAERRHLDRATDMIPEWWGLIRAEEEGSACRLAIVRSARTNPTVDLHAVVRLLWREEVLGELRALNLAAGLERGTRRLLWDSLADSVPESLTGPQLRARVRERLKHRAGWRADRRPRQGGDS
jgi:hypothetical protein